MLKGSVTLALIATSLLVLLAIVWMGPQMTEPFNNLKSLKTPIVTSTSSGIWFLTLAAVGWRASQGRPAAASTKTH